MSGIFFFCCLRLSETIQPLWFVLVVCDALPTSEMFLIRSTRHLSVAMTHGTDIHTAEHKDELKQKTDKARQEGEYKL